MPHKTMFESIANSCNYWQIKQFGFFLWSHTLLQMSGRHTEGQDPSTGSLHFCYKGQGRHSVDNPASGSSMLLNWASTRALSCPKAPHVIPRILVPAATWARPWKNDTSPKSTGYLTAGWIHGDSDPGQLHPWNFTKYLKKAVTQIFAAQDPHQLGSGDPVTSHVLFHCQRMDQT